MKALLGKVLFDSDECRELMDCFTARGYDCRQLSDDDVPTADWLQDCSVLVGDVPPTMLEQMPALRWMQTPSAGVDRYCKILCSRPDVTLTSASGAFGIAIAEYMIVALGMLWRKMPLYMQNQKSHIWKFMGYTKMIQGSRIAVIGTGDLGTAFASRMKALGAFVRGVHRTDKPLPACYDEAMTVQDLSGAVCDVDAVAVCLPGTPGTEKLISADIFSAMRPGTVFVNTGRGTTVDQDALIEALQSGHLGGAVLDVFEKEPLDPASPLWDMENVILSPHSSGWNEARTERIFDIVMENVQRYLHHEPLRNIVDLTQGY